MKNTPNAATNDGRTTDASEPARPSATMRL